MLVKLPCLCSLLPNPRATLEAVVRSRTSSLAGHIQAALVHNLLKLFLRITIQAEEEQDIEIMIEVRSTSIALLGYFVMC